MPGIQVLRFETRRPSALGRLAPHIAGARRPVTARPVPAHEPAKVHLASNPEGAHTAARALANRESRGPPPKPYVEVLFAGPPSYRAANQWTLETEECWARDCLAWLERQFPSAIVHSAVLHRDETSPHLHVLFVADRAGLRSWRQVRGKIDPNHREAMVRLQDSLHREVSVRYGLGRGEAAAKTKRLHRLIDRALAAEARTDIAQRQTEEAIAAAEKAKATQAETDLQIRFDIEVRDERVRQLQKAEAAAVRRTEEAIAAKAKAAQAEMDLQIRFDIEVRDERVRQLQKAEAAAVRCKAKAADDTNKLREEARELEASVQYLRREAAQLRGELTQRRAPRAEQHDAFRAALPGPLRRIADAVEVAREHWLILGAPVRTQGRAIVEVVLGLAEEAAGIFKAPIPKQVARAVRYWLTGGDERTREVEAEEEAGRKAASFARLAAGGSGMAPGRAAGESVSPAGSRLGTARGAVRDEGAERD